ncbi:hypothetical protein [Salipiger abyssi]|uniref:Uncharacterized protein n=1 Tax=Salipiger abyssi TaxID=1250539 RepID=A0A1P8UW08_9RHOB|nr:hypothetical protein [Salipiger abyssi]APZ53558.1 hypothetical protein Ga0080574_TMP3224 [Salipiger abyssi]
MTRLIVLTAAATCVSVAAYAATEALMTNEPEVIVIEVAPEELADCEETLRQVGQMPAVTDSGSPMLIDRASDLPSVACEAVEA